MRPSKRKQKRERTEMLKTAGIVTGVASAVVGSAIAITKCAKDKSSKTEDTLDDIKE